MKGKCVQEQHRQGGYLTVEADWPTRSVGNLKQLWGVLMDPRKRRNCEACAMREPVSDNSNPTLEEE